MIARKTKKNEYIKDVAIKPSFFIKSPFYTINKIISYGLKKVYNQKITPDENNHYRKNKIEKEQAMAYSYINPK